MGEWPEASRPGVYILFEKQSGETGDRAYVGESENVNRRLKDHLREKDFWNEVVFFTSKDDNLTKSHIMYLESRISQLSKEASRFQVEAGKTATEAVLPRSDRDSMEEFLSNVRVVLGVLGHRVLDTVSPQVGADSGSHQPQGLTDIAFTFNVREHEAQGRFSDEGFVLLEGSMVSRTVTESMPGKTKNIRSSWIEDGILKLQGESYILLSDQVLSSSSYAAAIVAGTSRSGPQSWSDTNGKSLKEIEAEIAEAT